MSVSSHSLLLQALETVNLSLIIGSKLPTNPVNYFSNNRITSFLGQREGWNQIMILKGGTLFDIFYLHTDTHRHRSITRNLDQQIWWGLNVAWRLPIHTLYIQPGHREYLKPIGWKNFRRYPKEGKRRENRGISRLAELLFVAI